MGYLKRHGVEVCLGVERSACLDVNAPFIFRVLNKRPYCIAAFSLTNCSTDSNSDSRMSNDSNSCSDHSLSIPRWLAQLEEIAPEADSVLLDCHQATQLLEYWNADYSLVSASSTHLTIMVLMAESSKDFQTRLEEVLLVVNLL